MRSDTGVEQELDRFSRILPLPYRVAIILVAGVWAWGLNLQYLEFVKIDVPSLIKYPARHASNLSHHASAYRLATLLTVPLGLSLLLFWTVTHGSSEAVAEWDVLPAIYLLGLVLVFVLPYIHLSRNGRYRFLSTLRRVSIGGLAEAKDGKFGDIILADVLTSYAKVLGDLFVCLCMFFSRGVSSTGTPNRLCGGAFVVPFIVSIPSIIRLRQCLTEFIRVQRYGQASEGWGGQHLANVLKYSTAFPVIIFSALQRGYDPAKFYFTEAGLFRLWVSSVFLNSFYSFYWDVAKDWDLNLLSSAARRNDPQYPYGLRSKRHFHSQNMYYVAIVLDFMLRCTWSFKLSPHLDHFNDMEGGIFTMEVLEVFRRWIWIFLRVESEWLRNTVGPVPDDILLGDFTNKVGED